MFFISNQSIFNIWLH